MTLSAASRAEVLEERRETLSRRAGHLGAGVHRGGSRASAVRHRLASEPQTTRQGRSCQSQECIVLPLEGNEG